MKRSGKENACGGSSLSTFWNCITSPTPIGTTSTTTTTRGEKMRQKATKIFLWDARLNFSSVRDVRFLREEEEKEIALAIDIYVYK